MGLILGIFFGFYLKNLILGAIVFCLGIMFSVSRTLIFNWFRLEFQTISQIHVLEEEINQNKDKEFFNHASLAEKEFIDKLQQLSKGTIVYEKSGKYLLAAEEQIDKTKKNIKAMALVDPNEWLSGGELCSDLDKQIKKNKKKKIQSKKDIYY